MYKFRDVFLGLDGLCSHHWLTDLFRQVFHQQHPKMVFLRLLCDSTIGIADVCLVECMFPFPKKHVAEYKLIEALGPFIETLCKGKVCEVLV